MFFRFIFFVFRILVFVFNVCRARGKRDQRQPKRKVFTNINIKHFCLNGSALYCIACFMWSRISWIRLKNINWIFSRKWKWKKENENAFIFSQHLLWHSIQIQTQLGFCHEWYANHTAQTMVIYYLSRFKTFDIFKFSTNEPTNMKCAGKENYVNNSNRMVCRVWKMS